MSSSPLLSIVIPVYNESSQIAKTLGEVVSFLSNKNYTYELIVVNDGSNESTTKILENCALSMTNLSVINLPQNMGKGFAVKTGMIRASGQFRLFMDADHSVNISNIDAFIEECQSGYDMVVASVVVAGGKIIGNDPIHRKILGALSRIFVHIMTSSPVKDTQRGFKLFTASAANILFPRQTINRFGFDIELITIAMENNLRIKELPVKWNNPPRSTVSMKSYWKTLFELFTVVSNRRQGLYGNKHS